MSLPDVAGNAGTVAPAQIVSVVPKLNVGVIFGLTVTLKVVVVAHCPPVGVKVYVPEFTLLTTEGLHVPEIVFADVAGKAGTTPPEHIVSVVPKLNAGVMIEFTVTVNVVVNAHCPVDGVNVYVPEF